MPGALISDSSARRVAQDNRQPISQTSDRQPDPLRGNRIRTPAASAPAAVGEAGQTASK